jgi:hypothetical protein
VDFEVAIGDPYRAIRRVRVVYVIPGPEGEKEEEIEFTLEGDLPPG